MFICCWHFESVNSFEILIYIWGYIHNDYWCMHEADYITELFFFYYTLNSIPQNICSVRKNKNIYGKTSVNAKRLIMRKVNRFLSELFAFAWQGLIFFNLTIVSSCDQPCKLMVAVDPQMLYSGLIFTVCSSGMKLTRSLKHIYDPWTRLLAHLVKVNKKVRKNPSFGEVASTDTDKREKSHLSFIYLEKTSLSSRNNNF